MRILQQFLPVLLCLVLACPGWAAFHAATEWDVRTTGNNANGGGFQAGSTGTDRSQSDAAYQAYTDIVIGATTTQGTSVLFPFDATTVGNIINITGGANCTVQRVQAVSQAAGVVTFDKSLGTAASVCTGNLGGALLTLAQAATLAIDSNAIHVKAGTYTITSAVSSNLSIMWSGYGTSHYDRGTKPLITTATSSQSMLGVSWYTQVSNIAFSNTAVTRWSAIYAASTPSFITVSGCLLTGVNAVYMNASGSRLLVEGTEIDLNGLASDGIQSTGMVLVQNSYIHGATGAGIGVNANGSSQDITIVRSLIVDNPVGISLASGSSLNIINSIIANNTSHGVSVAGTYWLTVLNSTIYGNGGYGMTADAKSSADMRKTAMGANVSGDRNNLGTGTIQGSLFIDDVVLTADPFTNSAAGDYSLNNAAGGGALLKATGFPGVFPGGTTTGYLDIGAVQTAAGAAAVAHGSAFVQ